MKLLIAPITALLLLAGCASAPAHHRAGVLDYLYPNGVSPTPPGDVVLALPLRVGVAFAPASDTSTASSPSFWTGETYQATFSESDKQRLLQQVVDAFQGVDGIRSIEIVPPSYLQPGGGFANVEQLRSLLGIDVLALLSYEQTQFQDFNKASLTYWTLVGGYFIEGNENETHTFVDTSVFDVQSHALLFNAAGRSKVEHASTVIEAAEQLRSDSTKGFERAIGEMIANLQTALTAFREQAKTGTVRGPGTPALQVSGGKGAGAVGALELGLSLALAGGWLLRRRAPAA